MTVYQRPPKETTETTPVDVPKTLLAHHREDLLRSGLSDSTIEASGFYSELNYAKLAAIANWKRWPKVRGPAMVIPFRHLDGTLNGYCRLKPDNPARDKDGKPTRKYESPSGQPSKVYFPLNTVERLKEPAHQLIITEGEKKSLKADQEGFACIGLVGVWGFCRKGRGDLIPDMEQISWKGREVYIVFDSDVADNPKSQQAESRLAVALQHRGATVKVVRLPGGPDGKKVGLDDWLVANEPGKLWELFKSAENPKPPDAGAMKFDAKDIDPMETAKAFLICYAMRKDTLTLRYHRDLFWTWRNGRYSEVPEYDLKAIIIGYLDPIYSGIKQEHVSNILGCVKAATLVHSYNEMPIWVDRKKLHSEHVSFKNGVLDLRKAIEGDGNPLAELSPSWFSAVCLPYDHTPGAKCPTWHEFLERNLEADAERIAIVQEYAGYCLTGDTGMQKFLLMTGEGANGKSVFCAGLTAIVGADNCSNVPLEGFGQRFELARTIGKLANIAAEVGDIDKAAEGHLKSFTSGDRMQFERKFKDPVEATPTAKLVLATNNPPRFADRSGGLWRRMIFMPWLIQIPEAEQIKGMDKPEWWMARGELPGMFLWALEGLRRLRRQGAFTRSGVCDDALDEYRADSNPAKVFLLDHYRADVYGQVVCAEMYERYAAWCGKSGYRPLGDSHFGREVFRAFRTAKKERKTDFDGKRKPMYVGVCEGADVD